MSSHNSRERLPSQSNEFLQEEDGGQQQQPMNDQEQHSGENDDYYCMKCQKKYNMVMCPHRTNINKYICCFGNCKRTFNIESGINRHILVHTGEKPFECDYQDCDQRFNQKSNLNRHKRLHKQERPFICEKCCKGFTTTTNLKQHSQIHLEGKQNRKKFICEIKGCSKAYLYRCNLKKHKQQHQDPIGECIGQKRPEYHSFGFDMGGCRIKIYYQETKDHYQANLKPGDNNSSSTYKVEDYLDYVNNQSQEEVEENIYQKLYGLLEPEKQKQSVLIYLHPQLNPILHFVFKNMVQVCVESGMKMCGLVFEDFGAFKDAVREGLEMYQV